MSEQFFKEPILNSPYEYPSRHWELDKDGQPTQRVVDGRRPVELITPIPKPRKRKGVEQQQTLTLDHGLGLSTEEQEYDPTPIINELRHYVDRWRELSDPNDWRVTTTTARLLQHWRHYEFPGIRPFFCQIEAAETVIWLTEVAPKLGKRGERFLSYLESANNEANPGLLRLALKMATGSGKTTVMAMLIAWQTLNSVRHPTSNRFTRGFLIVTPGLTVRDRLRVLQPNDPESYYNSRQLVPDDMLPDLERAKIVITNYHAFKLRERVELSRASRSFLQGRGPELKTLETEGQMLQRVMPELMGMKRIYVLNDEAHHCYRAKPDAGDEGRLTGDARVEAEKNREAARLWINGIEAVTRRIGDTRVIDLSATPFFLRGSGYREGTLFPWTMSDFSLMDAIECGIVKLPRVPVADNIQGEEMPVFRNLWEHIRKDMPRRGRRRAKDLDPHQLPPQLETAISALYGHYEKTFELWEREGMPVPPCFIIVCNNTATSKLIYDYLAGFYQPQEDGSSVLKPGAHPLFRNFDEHDQPYSRPRTLLVDSEQLESGEALDRNFRTMAADEIAQFRRDIIARTGDPQQAANITDQDLLREVMNTVGKEGRLGESIRCVVSVSMLTEGWDANNVTHILGVRAFGTQLLCEQVVGRALRRQSYDLNEDGRFNVEYADILGIPFDFTAKPVVSAPQPPRPTIHVKAMRPERDSLEIRFPRVQGYRVDLPEERLKAKFNDDHVLELTPAMIGPTRTQNAGIIGEGVELNLIHTNELRRSTLVYNLAWRLLRTRFTDIGEEPKLHLFSDLRRITRQWLDTCLVCKGGTYPAQLMYEVLADQACERMLTAIVPEHSEPQMTVILDPYNPTGSTRHVNFTTSKSNRWQTDARSSHVNWVVLDSDWEAEFCRIAESHPRVRAYVKNHGLGLEVPYRSGAVSRRYIPDFIVLVDDGRGPDDLLHLVVEIKGYRGENAKEKKATMESYWVPGVNLQGTFGRWAFAEFTDVWEMESDFAAQVEAAFNEMVEEVVDGAVGTSSPVGGTQRVG